MSLLFISPFKQSLDGLYFENALRLRAAKEPQLLVSLVTAQLRNVSARAQRQLTDSMVRIFPEIADHLKNLKRTHFENKPRHPIENLAIAVYAVAVLKNGPREGIHLIEKRTSTLTRTLLFHANKGLFAVFPKKGCARVEHQGGAKLACSSVMLSVNKPSSHYGSCFAVVSRFESAFRKQNAFKEAERFTTLGNMRGLPRLYTHVVLPDRILLLFKAYTANLKDILTERIFTPFQMVTVALDLLYGLLALHRAGIVHGDIKSRNAVCSTFDNGTTQSALIDLDQAFNPKKGECPNSCYRSGYHPSLSNTAPELFGVGENVKKFTPDDYFRMDIFALGICLERFFLATANPLPWQNSIHKSLAENFNKQQGVHKDNERLQKDQKTMHAQVTQYVEEQLLLCDAEEPKSTLSCLRTLAYKMMNVDPNQRISLELAIAQFEALRELRLRVH